LVVGYQRFGTAYWAHSWTAWPLLGVPKRQ